jgi:hypothetical protein
MRGMIFEPSLCAPFGFCVYPLHNDASMSIESKIKKSKKNNKARLRWSVTFVFFSTNPYFEWSGIIGP